MTSLPFVESTSTKHPTTSIALWHGALSDIPDGWILCDGNNGSPDLRNRFLKGSANYNDGAGATGGQDTVTLSTSQLPNHTHSTDYHSSGNHSHSITVLQWPGGSEDCVENSGIGYGTSTDGSHSHGSTRTNDTGGSGSIENRPHYYEVAFIYKI
jgi:microcystin-dependent protein